MHGSGCPGGTTIGGMYLRRTPVALATVYGDQARQLNRAADVRQFARQFACKITRAPGLRRETSR